MNPTQYVEGMPGVIEGVRPALNATPDWLWVSAAYIVVAGAAFIVGFVCMGLFVWRQLRTMPAKAWTSFPATHEHMSQVFAGPHARSNKRLLIICFACGSIFVACWVSWAAFHRFVVNAG